MKRILIAAAALVVAGCATYPEPYGYDAYGTPVYGGPAYAVPTYDTYYSGQPYYLGPSGVLGFFYFDGNGQRYWRERAYDGRWNDHRVDGNRGHWPGTDQGRGNWVERRPESGPTPPNSGRIPNPNPGGRNPYVTPGEAAGS